MCHVCGRLAPSPTGYIHLGNAWAFLVAWLAARSNQGQVILRLEDIDPARSRKEYQYGILRDLEWLGLDWDQGPDRDGAYGPYLQSERSERYIAAIEQLHCKGLIYPCFCTRKELRLLASAPHGPDEAGESVYPGTCRDLSDEKITQRLVAGQKACLRFRAPEAPLAFIDLIAGTYPKTKNLLRDDVALRRSDGVFSYHLAVVVDDATMGITQVVRGNDLLHCTPGQIQLFKALGMTAPVYAHIPLLCDEQGDRLAKRHASLEIRKLRAAGVRSQVVIGYLAWLGGLISRFEPLPAIDIVKKFSFSAIYNKQIHICAQDIEKILKLSN